MTSLPSRSRKAKKNSKRECITTSKIVIKVQFANLAQFAILNFAYLKQYEQILLEMIHYHLAFFIRPTNNPKFVIECCRTGLMNFSVRVICEDSLIIHISLNKNAFSCVICDFHTLEIDDHWNIGQISC